MKLITAPKNHWYPLLSSYWIPLFPRCPRQTIPEKNISQKKLVVTVWWSRADDIHYSFFPLKTDTGWYSRAVDFYRRNFKMGSIYKIARSSNYFSFILISSINFLKQNGNFLGKEDLLQNGQSPLLPLRDYPRSILPVWRWLFTVRIIFLL